MRHGMPSNSGAVHGARYNARLLAARIAETRFGREPARVTVPHAAVVDHILTELAEAPELSHQRGYLARILRPDADGAIVDDGIQPLAHWLDVDQRDGIAVTLEADGTGAIYPVLFGRRGGALSERSLDPDPLLRYDGADARKAVADHVATVLGVAV